MRRRCLALRLVALTVLQGCYVYSPLPSAAPEPGQSVILQINDRGRLDLGDRLGPGVTRISGRIASVLEEQVAINVSSVGYVAGEHSLWSGELVRLRREYVQSVQVRKLHRGRTWTAVGVATVAFVAFAASRDLLAIFSGSSEPGPGEPPPPSLRITAGFHL